MVINSFHSVKIEHEKFGVKEDLTFFNGSDFLVHVPYKHLAESIINTGKTEYTSSDHVKSKLEALVTK